MDCFASLTMTAHYKNDNLKCTRKVLILAIFPAEPCIARSVKPLFPAVPLVEMNYTPPPINLITLFYYTVNEHKTEANNPNWVYPGSVEMILFGLSNVMIKYKYEPFISQMLNWNPTTNEYTRKEFSREEYSLQVIYYAKQFIESRKK